MSVTQEIKSRLDIVDVISQHVTLRRSGRNFAGFCPFHTNTKTPAFYVSPERQTWHCFGACAEGGDVFSFIMKQNGWEFKEALRHLADKAGVQLKEYRPKDPTQVATEEKHAKLLTAAADYFHQLFLHAPEAETARAYLADRGLTAQTIADFQLGYALNQWNACETHFVAQGYTRADLTAVGLLTENPEKESVYDRFRDRLIFPIRNGDGQTVGFGARTLQKDGIPKYLNSPQTALFDKSRILYGLDKAKRPIRSSQQAVIVEGYMDVIRAHQANYQNVVAQMGTALTEAQLRLLKRYSKNFVIALDADEAGKRAMLRGIQTASDMKDEKGVGIDNLLRLESPLKVDIKAVVLPDGKDPDDLIRADAESWPTVLEKAQSLGDFVIDTLTESVDLGDAKAKSAVSEEIAPFIHAISNPVEQAHFWQKLGRILSIDEQALRQMGKPKAKRPQPLQKKRPNEPPAWLDEMPPEPEFEPIGQTQPDQFIQKGKISAPRNVSKIQANLLRHCLETPRLIAELNERLVLHGQEPVRPAQFTRIEDQQIWSECATDGFILKERYGELEPLLTDRIDQIMAILVPKSAEHDQLLRSLTLSVLNWRLMIQRELLSDVKAMMVEAKRSGDQESESSHDLVCRELSGAVYNIYQAQNALSTVS